MAPGLATEEYRKASLKLQDIQAKAKIRGLSSSGVSTVVTTEWYGSEAVNVVFETPDGKVDNRIVFQDDLAGLELVSAGQSWTYNADGDLLRLAVEADRIKLAHHFDPYLAIHTSLIQPLPHQITAVYGEMLTRQPLRFLLADDPGAGKTIMAGLLVKELIARGDLKRCLVVAPGNLVEQWQDELGEKFNLEFDILTGDMIQSSRSGNPFNNKNLLIARLDVLARNEELQEKLTRATEWDLVIADEAHRMSASYFSGEVKYTKRYQLGQQLGRICRHFLLMSATPHNGHEEDFQLFMALLDGDRFEGKYRDSVHVADTRDMMRRLTKEELLKFDGKPLFPERRANTVRYSLSDEETALYAAVTEYVRTEMNRVQRFAETDNKKRVNVGFALQILQRRLASSSAAIHSSLKRRREKLEAELREAKLLARGRTLRGVFSGGFLEDDIIAGIDEDGDIDDMEDTISAAATTAESIEQLEQEIETLRRIEGQALCVLQSGVDTKWNQLDLILDDDLMTHAGGMSRKLIIFTEAKDTLIYLVDKIRTRLGRPEAVDAIHGAVNRDERRNIIRRFMQDRDLLVLVANDAAGEGVNLQRGHLMVNYDLPWNPNKIEQRFGRIHRIGQTEVCHLWNLVARDTREGEVYGRLLEKLENVRKDLHGQVFDVLGDLFDGNALKDLLWEAVRYGEREDVRTRLDKAIDGKVNIDHINALLKERKLTDDVMPVADVRDIRLKMECAEAQRLQPHHIQSFFLEAFARLGGRIKAREEGRHEIINVPIRIRDRGRLLGRGAPLGKSYERICFDKDQINQQPVAEFICPGHPLLDAVISLIQEVYGHLLHEGAVMVDESDFSESLEALFLIEHEIHDGRRTASGLPQTVSKQLQFARLSSDGRVSNGGLAPHLNLRCITREEAAMMQDELSAAWLQGEIEERIKAFAVIELAKEHLEEVRKRRLPEIDRIEREVKKRLTQEIRHWDNRAAVLKEEEKAGRKTRLNWQNAERRAEELADRLQRRLAVIAEERALAASPPSVKGGLLLVPRGLLEAAAEAEASEMPNDPRRRKAVEDAAMQAVMDAERGLGYKPQDVADKKQGYDILSYDPLREKHRFIEVKGRAEDADTITVSRNEIITALNKPEDFILAIVEVSQDFVHQPRYLWQPFAIEPSFDTVHVTYRKSELLDRSEAPR